MSVLSNLNEGWAAEIHLHYQVKRGVTRLTHRQQKGPLMVQRPFYPEKGIPHTYLLHPPGGVVGGDSLDIHINVADSAHALVTTPGATKFYRSSGHLAQQRQNLEASQGAVLEWLPLENIFFPAANVALNTEIKLHSSSRFIGWEMQCFGRPMLNELFSLGAIKGRTRIYIDGLLTLAESMNVQGGKNQAAGMREFPMLGSLYIYPATEELKSKCLEELNSSSIVKDEDIEFGITDVDGILIVRALGFQTEPIATVFIQLWKICREYWFGYIPEIPRIWAT